MVALRADTIVNLDLDLDLEVIDSLEIDRRAFGISYFDRTRFICQRRGVEDEYYFASGRLHLSELTAEGLKNLRPVKIPNDLIFPDYEAGLTIAPNPLPHNVYIKGPRLIDFDDGNSTVNVARNLLHEARMCELLKGRPHPNIAEYHGCIVKDGVIKGLCFKRYPLNLEQRAAERIPMDIQHCFKYIKKGIKHMHTFNVAHNNIKPVNVMMDGDNPVIIDFASTLPFGKSLAGYRCGAPPWIPPEAKISKDYNDHYAAQQIYHWMRELN